VSLSRGVAVLLGFVLASRPVLAYAEDEEETSDEEEDDGEEDGGTDGETEPADTGKVKDKTKPKQEKEGAIKQDLSGHDLGTNKKENLFEKDRFFVDKADTEKTEGKTLIQGSLASSTLLYTESGGTYGMMQGSNAAKFSRYYTDLRLQTDFRHIKGGRWDARIDARARFVPTPDNALNSVDPNHIQSGFNGQNEYDLRELWLFHSGRRADVFFGRQFVADLGGVKFDGLRVDYASSRKLTFIGFGGLYPVKGSRSIDSDYPRLRTDQGVAAGKLVGAGGFGGAYRTINSYGSIGGVALVPFAGESPRIFATSSGYLRSGSTLDVYHFALIDLASAIGPGLTNVSAGANYKPGPRLRLTANFNRVDVDTLNVQANAFLNDPETGAPTVVQNETYLKRLSTSSARAGVSAGLGQLQRFEVTLQAAYRFRPAVALDPAGPMGGPSVTLPATKGVDLYGAITDRRSIKDLRLGVDVSRSFAVGKVAFQRSEIFGIRASAARELKDGHGEWEAEVSYTTTKDKAAGIICAPGVGGGMPTPQSCFGSSSGAIISFGGTLFYRINRDWLAMGSAFITRQTLTHNDVDPAAPTTVIPGTDPPVTGLTGFARIAYRF
jgi:hypothetical protein